MSSTVCQGLQSCLEPWLVEPGHLRLKLAPPKPNFPRPSTWAKRPCEEKADKQEETNTTKTKENNNNGNTKNDSENKKIHSKNGELGGWSFIQALTNTTQNPKVEEDNKIYVHPLVKLSEKSLEMCTESLGSETGSDGSEISMDDLLDISSNGSDFSPKAQYKIRETPVASKKVARGGGSGDFPPPLSSISGGSSCVRVKPHREGGRLVIKAIEVSFSQTYFHAERKNGRLRLRLLSNFSASFDMKEAKKDEEACGDGDDEEKFEEEEDINEDGDETEDYDAVDDSVSWGEGMEGNIENFEGEIAMEKFPNPSRCKEGGGHRSKGLWTLEPYWVATS